MCESAMASGAPFERLPSIAVASQMPIDSSSCLLSSAPPAFIFRATTRVPAGDSPWQMHN